MNATAPRSRAALPPAGDMSWQARALCADDPDWQQLSQLDQKRICGGCPVHTECLNYALEYAPYDPSVWGGYNGWQRSRMLGKRPRTPSVRRSARSRHAMSRRVGHSTVRAIDGAIERTRLGLRPVRKAAE